MRELKILVAIGLLAYFGPLICLFGPPILLAVALALAVVYENHPFLFCMGTAAVLAFVLLNVYYPIMRTMTKVTFLLGVVALIGNFVRVVMMNTMNQL
jgi:uncharacterized RDD family membrane protein YckC